MSGAMAEPAEAPRKATPLQMVKAVLSAFIGIRKGAAHDRDMATLKPVPVIVTGIVLAALLVLGMLLLVHLITG